MNRTEKAATIDAVKEKFVKANAAFVAEYRGITVEALTKLRSDVRKGQGEVKVIKNRLARIAAKGTAFEALGDQLKGPLLIAFSYKDPVAVAKALQDNLSDTSPLNLKFGSLGAKSLDAKQVEALSKLPDRNTLLAMMLGTIRAPIQNFVNVINAVPQGFVTALVQLKEKKEKQA